MRDYQLRSVDSYVLPREVFYQCIWIVRDIDRLRSLKEADLGAMSSFARERLEAVDAAISFVPCEYRPGIIEHIRDREPYADKAHENTWKRWQQRFLYELAVNLLLV